MARCDQEVACANTHTPARVYVRMRNAVKFTYTRDLRALQVVDKIIDNEKSMQYLTNPVVKL